MNVVFIGNEYYAKTSGRMGSLYQVEGDNPPAIRRTHWGEVEQLLVAGEQVVIRPPTIQERMVFNAIAKFAPTPPPEQNEPTAA